MKYRHSFANTLTLVFAAALTACGGSDGPPPEVKGIATKQVARFASPWAVAVTPANGLLVTDNFLKTAYLVSEDGTSQVAIAGLPTNMAALFDIKLSPDFAISKKVFFSFGERGDETTPREGRQCGNVSLIPSGLAVLSATLKIESSGAVSLDNSQVIWRQTPKICTSGEYGGRMAFSPDGKYLYVTAGGLQEFEPVQSLSNTLGKVVRLHPDGRIPADNPFVATANAKPEIWTLGHRNHYGLIFTPDGKLWSHEHGPKGGDEINQLQAGKNYGWPWVSWGIHYDGGAIPNPKPGDGYEAPTMHWTPAVAPAGFMLYTGNLFGAWKGDAILTGLQSKGLVRVRFDGSSVKEIDRFSINQRARDLAQGRDGALWVLEDAPGGYLLKVTPTF